MPRTIISAGQRVYFTALFLTGPVAFVLTAQVLHDGAFSIPRAIHSMSFKNR